MIAAHRIGHGGDALEALVLCLLAVALIAGAVYLICHLVGRRDIGALGAALVAVVGGLLCLL